MNTLIFNEVYIKSAATACGPLEAQGPLAGGFDVPFQNLYCGESNFEMAEVRLLKEAVYKALEKGKMKIQECDFAIGSDLINQLGTSHIFMKECPIPFVGIYGACSNSALSLLTASMSISSGFAKRILTFTSSHNATAERQFRFPNEYGVQKPPTTTFTATGAGAIILSNEKGKIEITQGTIGRIIDFDFKNANDMGSAMAPAAYDTIQRHFKNTNTGFADYDLVVTGDLSSIGNEILIDLFKLEKDDHKGKLVDCGCILYDLKKQRVFSGGSGCACSSLVLINWIFDKLERAIFHKILFVATGALLSPVFLQQKQSIPCIAHAIVLESHTKKEAR